MELQTHTTTVKEVHVTYTKGSIFAYPWSNCEGASIIMENKEGEIKLAASLQWEDINALITALSAVQV